MFVDRFIDCISRILASPSMYINFSCLSYDNYCLIKPFLWVLAVAMDLQSDDDYSDWDDPLEHIYDGSYGYCIICRKIVSSHSPEECPNKAKAFGMFCFECMGPCKLSTDEHKEHQAERIKMCSNCCSQGRHWTQDCPYSDDSD